MADLLRFDGEQCGLFDTTKSGDRHEAANYMLRCPCGVDLGPLARFRMNAEKLRTAKCLRCGCAIIVNATAQVVGMITAAEVRALETKKDAEDKARLEKERGVVAPAPSLLWTGD